MAKNDPFQDEIIDANTDWLTTDEMFGKERYFQPEKIFLRKTFFLVA